MGLDSKQKDPISFDSEDELWRRGLLGTDNPEKLVNTVFWLIGVNFGIRGGDDHRKLRLHNFKFENSIPDSPFVMQITIFEIIYDIPVERR